MTDESSKISLYLCLVSDRLENDFLFTWNGLKFVVHIESETSQFEVVVKLFVCFIAQN